MGGNDEKGMTLCLLTCSITSTPAMNNHLVPENNGAHYYRAQSLPSLGGCCTSHSHRPGMPRKALSHESSAKMWHFTDNSEWIQEKLCSCVTCIACREQVSQGTADLQNSNCEAKRKGALHINFFVPEGDCICSALWTVVASYQFTEVHCSSFLH